MGMDDFKDSGKRKEVETELGRGILDGVLTELFIEESESPPMVKR
jgi:hypothetical protein